MATMQHKMFRDMMKSIAQSYTFLAEDREELDNAKCNLELKLTAIYQYSRMFKDGSLSLDKFKAYIYEIVTDETNKLILVDEKGKEISDEVKTLANQVAIYTLDKIELEKFVTLFYRELSSARTYVYHFLNHNTPFMIMSKSMMPTQLTIFDDDIKAKETKKSEVKNV